MAVHEMTEKEREQMLDEAFKKMKIKRKHLSKEELEKEILDYINKQTLCSLATCGNDGAPRISLVDYVNEGFTLYIFSEGGGKFKNLKENKRVAVGIGSGTRAISTRGVNIWGIADVFTDDDPEFAHGLEVIRPILEEMGKAIGAPVEFPKGIMRMIRITPTKMVYSHNKNGINNAHWTAE